MVKCGKRYSLAQCKIFTIILLALNFFFPAAQNARCLQTNSSNGLPLFQGYTGPAGYPDRRIHHQNQAIIPSYRFSCCGNITEWGVDLNPEDEVVRFTLDFQVWRPSPTVSEDRCYSLVNNYIARSTSLPCGMPELTRQTGPLGLAAAHIQSELMEYSMHTSKHVAPVISLSTTAYSCSPSTTNHLPHSSPTFIQSTATTDIYPGNRSSTTSTTSLRVLILGVTLPVIILAGGVVTVTVLVAVVITMHKTASHESNNNEQLDEVQYMTMCTTILP